jgi:integrase/recombinase XerD
MSISWEKEEKQAIATLQIRQQQQQHSSPSSSYSFSDNPAIDKKVKAAVQGGLQGNVQRLFSKFPTDEDRELVADFILTCMHQENIAIKTKRVYISSLASLSKYFDYKKSFNEMTAKDIAADYLGSMHRDETVDPDQKWVNTHNTKALCISKFYRWKAYPHLNPQQRKTLPKDQLPPVLRDDGLTFVARKGSRSPVKAKDIWTDQDTALFLKYCTEDKRLACYHSLAIDTSARPDELLQLKIGDIEIKKTPDGSGRLYASLDIGRHSKKKRSRIVPMINSILYYRDYLQSGSHPNAANPNAFVFVSREYEAKYRNAPISVGCLRANYYRFRDKRIPALLKRPDVPPEEKLKLQQLKDTKKWNPYNMRHSSITKYARNPNINEYTLRQHCGWTKSSNMIEVYTHELNGESFEDVMLACGVDLRDRKERELQIQQELSGKHCPYCRMLNIPDARFCSECKLALTIDAFNEAIEEKAKAAKEAEQRTKEFEEMKAKMEILQANVSSYLRASLPYTGSPRRQEEPLQIIAWNEESGSEGLFKAAAIARAKNEAREKEHQRRYHRHNHHHQQLQQQQ